MWEQKEGGKQGLQWNMTLEAEKSDVRYIPDWNDTLVIAAVLDFLHSLEQKKPAILVFVPKVLIS